MGKWCFGKRRVGASTSGHVLRFFARMDVAIGLMLLVSLLAALGSCLPQRPPSMGADTELPARWQESVQARYGRLTRFLQAAAAFQWFRSPIFWLATGVLVFATLVCTLKRWRALWRQALRRPVRCSRAALEHATHAASMNLPPEAEPVGALRKGLERRGFSVRSETDGDVVYLRGDRNRLTPLATVVTHTAVPLLALGVILSALWGQREELILDLGEAVPVPITSACMRKPASVLDAGFALRVRNEGLSIARYADGDVAGYDAKVVFSEGGLDTTSGHIRLNQPLTYRGIVFTLKGYAPREEGYAIVLRAVRDPGYGPVITAAFVMFLALTVSFNFPHCCVWARIEPQGAVQLAGRADRRAWGFEQQFAALGREIGERADP
jgi:cytochrome c biogenesis protein ResB